MSHKLTWFFSYFQRVSVYYVNIFTIKYFMELKRVYGFFAQKQVKTITQRLRLSDREKSIRSKKNQWLLQCMLQFNDSVHSTAI